MATSNTSAELLNNSEVETEGRNISRSDYSEVETEGRNISRSDYSKTTFGTNTPRDEVKLRSSGWQQYPSSFVVTHHSLGLRSKKIDVVRHYKKLGYVDPKVDEVALIALEEYEFKYCPPPNVDDAAQPALPSTQIAPQVAPKPPAKLTLHQRQHAAAAVGSMKITAFMKKPPQPPATQ